MADYHSDRGSATIRNAAFRCLADARNRVVLGRLLEAAAHTEPIDALESALAEAFGPERPDAPRLWLVHELLPRLEDAGLVVVDDERALATDHAALGDPVIRSLLSDGARTDEAVDAFLRAVANPRRRRLCSVLRRRDEPTTIRNAARALAAVEAAGREASYRELAAEIRVSLVHEHVPALVSAGVLERDAGGRIALDGPADVDPDCSDGDGSPVPTVIG